MQIVEALEALLGRRYSSMPIYPNESPIADILCKPFVKNGEVFECDHITLSKNDDSFIIEIHTLAHYEKRSLQEYKDLVFRLDLFTGNWKLERHSRRFGGIPYIKLKNQEARDGFIRLLKLYASK